MQSKKDGQGKSVAVIGTRGYPSYYSGFETLVRKLAPALADAGWRVTVYGRRGTSRPDDPSRDDRIETVETWGIESKSLSTLSYGLTSVLHALWHRPDVALVMNVAVGYWIPLLRLARIPVVVNVDGIEWERAKWGRLARAVFKGGAWMTAKSATTLVFDALAIGEYWQEHYDRDGVFIPYGGDHRGPLPLEHGLTSREYALIVARFVPENTVLEFFDAAEQLAHEHPVVLVGSSGYGGEIEARAAKLAASSSRVMWLGHIHDEDRLHALWQHAGAYFHGHSVGGTNPSLVQAMACGAPIVARDTVYNREVLGAAGMFVAAQPSAIASTVADLLRDPAQQAALSKAASDRADGHYTWASVNAAYEAALAACLPGAAIHQDSAGHDHG